MRNVLAALVVATLLGIAMPAQAQSSVVVDFTDTAEPVTVDLVQHAGQQIRFQVTSAQFGNNPSAGFVTLTCPEGTGVGQCAQKETIIVPLNDPLSNGNWRGTLQVDNRNLVTGNWTIAATGQSGTSTSVVPSDGSYHLNVTAPTMEPPTIRAFNLDSEVGYATVAKNQNVAVSVNSTLIRSVLFQIDNGSLLDWGTGPFSLAASNFVPTGIHTLKVVAEDRMGQSDELTFQVYADTNDPDLGHDIPSRLFLGVPNKIPLNVSDDSDFTVSAILDSEVSTLSGKAGSGTYVPEVTPTKLGNQLITVRAQDIVGNFVQQSVAVEVVPLDVDITIVSATQTDGGAILNEDMEVTIMAAQNNGTIAIPVNITLLGKDMGQFMVAPEGTTSHVVTLRMAPGIHIGNLSLTPASLVTETMPLDNIQEMALEQFMARVIYRNDVYHIRAGSNGLPDVAVGADGTTYALSLMDRGLSQVYAFTVDGVELFWNPASLITTVSEPGNPTGDADDEGIPGVPLVALLAAIAGAAFLRRRD